MPTRRRLLVQAIAAGLVSTALPGLAFGGGLTSRDQARAKFAAAIAAAYEVDASSIVVEPQAWNQPENPFDALALDDLLAFRADFAVDGQEAKVFGFASTGQTMPAFARFAPIGRPGGIASLMEACDVLAAKPSVGLGGIVARIAWAYPGFGPPLAPPDGRWTVKRTKDGATITYHVRTAEQTGVQRYWKVIVSVEQDYTTTLRREEIEWPEP